MRKRHLLVKQHTRQRCFYLSVRIILWKVALQPDLRLFFFSTPGRLSLEPLPDASILKYAYMYECPLQHVVTDTIYIYCCSHNSREGTLHLFHQLHVRSFPQLHDVFAHPVGTEKNRQKRTNINTILA